MTQADYPERPADRDRWILAHRGPKNRLDPLRPYAFLWEEERGINGDPVSTATLFLTNRECPFRCLMCDLWQNTLDTTVPPGAIPRQIVYALTRLPEARQVKLYNAGSFFDPRAIPREDDPAIARLCARFERVIVESHPGFIGERARAFRRLLPDATQLEVAIGLETVHPAVLERLNKRITVVAFRHAARFLADHGMALRVFLLLRPPFLSEVEGVEWACRSLMVAFDAGATVCTVIPTRAGNGAMEALARAGQYAPPSLRSLEHVQEYGLRLKAGRVFADLWDIEPFARCSCSAARIARLEHMNRTQTIPPPVCCASCEGTSLDA